MSGDSKNMKPISHSRDWKRFYLEIINTNGNPSSKVAEECGLQYVFEELCMRNLSREQMVENAKNILIKLNEGSKNDRNKVERP